MSAKKVKTERRTVSRIEAIRPQPTEPKRWPLLTIRVLATVGLLVAGYLSFLHYQAGVGGTIDSPFCGAGTVVNCNAVLGSSYARLFGAPVALWAVLTYALVLAASFNRQTGWLILLCSWGFIFSMYMAGLSLLTIKSACLFCLTLYAINTGLLVSAIALARSTATFTLQQTMYGLAGCVVLVAGLGWWQAQAAAGYSPLSGKKSDEAEFRRSYANRPLVTLAGAERHAKGPRDATITINEFVDFR